MATLALQRRTIRSIRTRTIGWITALWGAAVLGVLTWQTVTYRGLVARVAEWQFARFGTYFPIATIFWLLALFTLPLLALLVVRLRRRQRRAGARDDATLLEAARTRGKVLIGLAAAALVVACVLLIAVAAIRDGTPRTVILAETGNGPGIEGPVRIRGVLRLNRLGVYRPAVIVPMRPLFFAPLTATDAVGPTLQYFAEVGQTAPAAAKPVELRGVAVASALPGPLRQLYLDAGYRVSDRTFVVYPNVEAARRRYLGGLVLPLAFALAFGLAALIQYRSVRRLKGIVAAHP